MRQVPRRDFLIAAGALLAVPKTAHAQQRTRVYRIGVMSVPAASTAELREDSEDLVKELRKRGYEEGRNCIFEFRAADRDPSRLPSFAAELVALKVDVIVADLPPAILAARRATSTIPIVMQYGMVPMELGLIDSLARPGGNVTGMLLQAPETAAKVFEIVRDIMGRQASIAMVYQPDYPGLEPYMRQCEQAAIRLGLRSTMFPIRTVEELDAAFQRIAKERPKALFVVPTGVPGRQTERVLKFASDQHIPAIYSTKWPVELGALLAWEASFRDLEIRTAAIIDKILKGTSPAEIPVEEPTRFELWINMKTANALGIKIPQSVLLQAAKLFD